MNMKCLCQWLMFVGGCMTCFYFIGALTHTDLNQVVGALFCILSMMISWGCIDEIDRRAYNIERDLHDNDRNVVCGAD